MHFYPHSNLVKSICLLFLYAIKALLSCNSLLILKKETYGKHTDKPYLSESRT